MPWLCGLLLFFYALAAAAYICYRIAYTVPKPKAGDLFRMPDTGQYAPYRAVTERMIRDALSIPYEEMWIQSFDGVKLFGRYYASLPGAPVQLMFHGYRSAAERDFCGGLPFAISQGYNVLLVDQRAHGRSGGSCLTFGVKERYDCLAWIGEVRKRFGADIPVMLYGMSMGAATVLMTAGLSLPENVRGIVADCGYTSPAAILKKVLRDRHYPVRLVYPLLRLGGRLYGGFDTEAASAAEAMRHCTVPVCLIHGEDDRFVPCEMSRENYRLCASDQKRLLTFAGAGHGLSYFLDEERYLKEVRSFLDLCLG